VSDLERVEVLVELALYDLVSVSSGSRYYVGTRPGISPRDLRIAGLGSTSMRLDGGWKPFTLLECLPRHLNGHRLPHSHDVGDTAVEPWVLGVDCEHVFTTPDATPGRPPLYWVKSSPCREIHLFNGPPQAVRELLPATQRDEAW
jgi:hypothetical protein